jgi:hypothetical protein
VVRKYRLYSFLTSALDGGEVVSVHAPAALCSPPPIETTVTIGLEVWWTSELVWTQRLEKISFASVGDRTLVIQSLDIIQAELARLLYTAGQSYQIRIKLPTLIFLAIYELI